MLTHFATTLSVVNNQQSINIRETRPLIRTFARTSSYSQNARLKQQTITSILLLLNSYSSKFVQRNIRTCCPLRRRNTSIDCSHSLSLIASFNLSLPLKNSTTWHLTTSPFRWSWIYFFVDSWWDMAENAHCPSARTLCTVYPGKERWQSLGLDTTPRNKTQKRRSHQLLNEKNTCITCKTLIYLVLSAITDSQKMQ